MSWTRFTEFFSRSKATPQRHVPTTFRAISPGASGTKRRGLPRFQGTANDPDRGPAGALDPARVNLLRAFTPSQPVNDVRMFAGRKDLLLMLIRAIEEQQLHVVIFGDRGIGKTSLLHILAQLAREARYIVRYTSCSASSEFDATFRAIAQEIPLLYHADFDPTSDAAERGATLAELMPDEPLSVARVSDAFAKLSGTRVLIVLDEFDRASSTAFKQAVAELIKSLSDKGIRVQIIIAGVAANLTELVEHIPSIRRNVLGIPVTAMGRDELIELIRLGEAVGGINFPDQVVDAIVEAAQGSPYVTALLSQQAASAAADRRSTEVSKDDVIAAIRRTLADIKVRMALLGRQALERVETERPAPETATIARRALHNFGFIGVQPAGDLADLVAKDLDRLAMIGALRPTQVGEVAGYEFIDDSMPLYLWLRGRLS